MEAPKVFISYSHDSPEHAERVLTLSDRLRQDGIDSHIDQYEVSPPEGWPRWMVNKVEWADFVLVVCTEIYQQRFKGKVPAGQGKGVKREGTILTQELYDAEAHNTRFIPVVFASNDTAQIPVILKGQTYYDVSTDKGYVALYRCLTSQPAIVTPHLGGLKSMPPLKYHKLKLEEVFKTSGIPTYTFVEPTKYSEILLSLRTPGRCLVVEGPSGIGKTTAVEKALESINILEKITKLSARMPNDIEYIESLPDILNAGNVLVDDYHRLSTDIQSKLADYLKVLADTEDKNTKVIILGINRAGDSLIQFAPDLVNRIDIVRFETEPDEKIEELILKGEEALNIYFNIKDEIINAVRGSFYLAQMLCREACLMSNILEQSNVKKMLKISFESVRTKVYDRLSMSFQKRCENFCRGTKLRKEGRAPYLHILHWLAHSQSWTLDLREAIRHHSELRGSVSQIVDKGFLNTVITSNNEIRQVIHFNVNSSLLTVEDPQFIFYIRNIPWRQFARNLGFLFMPFERKYDFALSFAGADRDVAEALFNSLRENEVEVFYDKNEQHRIIAEDIEAYLQAIYQTEAQFVIVLLGQEYPKRIWTKIESKAFKERFAEGNVIPVWFTNVDVSMFDITREKGGLSFDRLKDFDSQIKEFTDMLLKKLSESRQQ